jgi:hypothetical protein
MSTRIERIKLSAAKCFQDILKIMNDRDLNLDTYEKKSEICEYRAPIKEGVKDLLVQTLIKNSYSVNEFFGCYWYPRDHTNHDKPDCNKVLWLSITKIQTLTVKDKVIAIFSEIEELMYDEHTNVIKFPSPSDKIIKNELIKMLKQNNYSVVEITTPCDHDIIEEKVETNKHGFNRYSIIHICLHDGSKCTFGYWLLIRNTSSELITAVVDRLIKVIDEKMCGPTVRTMRPYVPLKAGVKEALVQKLCEHEYEVTFDSVSYECKHQCKNDCQKTKYTCRCIDIDNAESCNCNKRYCSHIFEKENDQTMHIMIISEQLSKRRPEETQV